MNTRTTKTSLILQGLWFVLGMGCAFFAKVTVLAQGTDPILGHIEVSESEWINFEIQHRGPVLQATDIQYFTDCADQGCDAATKPRCEVRSGNLLRPFNKPFKEVTCGDDLLLRVQRGHWGQRTRFVISKSLLGAQRTQHIGYPIDYVEVSLVEKGVEEEDVIWKERVIYHVGMKERTLPSKPFDTDALGFHCPAKLQADLMDVLSR